MLCFLYTYHMERFRIIYTFFGLYKEVPFQIYMKVYFYFNGALSVWMNRRGPDGGTVLSECLREHGQVLRGLLASSMWLCSLADVRTNVLPPVSG
jgi:hypothetical protein